MQFGFLNRWTVVLIIIFSVVIGVQAQTDLDETYNSPDGEFRFAYPSRWTLDEREDFVLVGGLVGRDFLLVDFFNPIIMRTATDFEDDVTAAGVNASDFFDFIGARIGTLEIDGRETELREVNLEEDEGIAFIIQMSDDSVGMVVVIAPTDAIATNENFISDIIATYDVSTGETATTETTQSRGENITLRNHDADNWRDAIEELEDLGLIANGGSLVFNENRAFFDGIGSWFTPLASRSNNRNIVMAATLTFSPDSDEYETCSLLARIVPTAGSSVDTYLEVGIDNDTEAYYIDWAAGAEEPDFAYAPLSLNLNASHHILFIAADDEITVFVNGRLTFDRLPIEERSGYFGIALVGRGADSRCEGSNIWVYNAPILREGVCEASSTGTVNKRSEPSTSASRAGTINAGDFIRILGQTTGSDGFTWWQLEDQSWVREDVVNETGDCARVPEVSG